MDNIFYLILGLGLVGLLLLVLILVVYLYFKRQRTTFIIINPDGRLIYKSYGTIKRQTEINGCTYVYDDKCSLHNFWGKKIYFYSGNPNPINFVEGRLKNVPNIKGQDLNIMLKSRLIEQLFSTDNLQQIILVLLIIALIGIGISVFAGFTGGGMVTLEPNGNNTMIIRNACVEALRSVGV